MSLKGKEICPECKHDTFRVLSIKGGWLLECVSCKREYRIKTTGIITFDTDLFLEMLS